MNRQQIDALVKEMNVDTATGPVDARVQQIVVRLVGDLFQAIEDLDISQTELWKGLEYFTDAGQANELGGFARMDDGSETDKIPTLFIEGTVTDTDGNIIEGAKVEVWHANSLGNYSFFDKSQSDFNLRRSILTDADGKYVAQTTMPVGYGCPPDGTTQAVLNKLGRHGNRPSHVHYFVSAPGYRKLTTQFNIEGDQYLWDDFAFATRDGLVATAVDVTDEAEIARRGLNQPFKHITFNIELVKEQQGAPSTEVDRRRASA